MSSSGTLFTCHANLGHAYIHCDNYTAALNHFENALIVEKEAKHNLQKKIQSLFRISIMDSI